MIAHTSGFKESITTLGRDINVLINYYSVVYNLITEDNKLLITQNNAKLLTEELTLDVPVVQLTNEDIITLTKNNLGELFRTYMKSFDLETTHHFNVGDKMEIQVGTSVNGEIEYLNYGKYYIYTKHFNEDTQTYTYTLCDRMLFTMQQYNNNLYFGNVSELSCKTLLKSILKEQCGFADQDIVLDDTLLVNKDEVILYDTLKDIDLTCRDVLDMIMQLQGCSLVIEYDPETKREYITTKTITSESQDTIGNDILKDTNVTIGEKYGPINSLLFSRSEELDNIERKNDSSIQYDGRTRYAIKDNLILDQDNREDFIDALFEVMDGLEFYVCDIDTIGLGYIEYLDRITINAHNNLYNTICLKDVSNISNGMTETFTTPELQETEQEYQNVGMSDKTASITMDKLKGTIVLKTDSEGKIAEVRLDSTGDTGSLVEIGADNIKLEGYTTINDGFSVDLDGNMVAKSGKIAEWTIDDEKGIYTGDGGAQAGLGIFGKAHAFWAGGTDPGTAPFHVGHGGDVSCSEINITGGQIQLYTQGMWNGIRVNSNSSSPQGIHISGSGIDCHNSDNDTTVYVSFITGTTVLGRLDCKTLYVDGDLTVTGSKNRIVKTKDNGDVLLNAYETTTPYFGDIGSNRTDKNGTCRIDIDEIFAQTISLKDYKVFIQECGEGNLYVIKHKDYFEVKGTPDLDFDWEIKAIQKGYENVRLQEYEAPKPIE